MNARAMLARHRRNPLLRLSAVACEKFLRAYNNQFNFDIHHNGEDFLISTVLGVAPGIVLDVGGNVGTYAAACLKYPGCEQVHIFEISAPTQALLKAAVGYNQRATINDFGLGSEELEIEILHAPDSSDRTSLYAVQDGYSRTKVPAYIKRGDDYLEAQAINSVSLLKIDVEGMDFDVLKGFSRSLDARRIKAIQFEHGHPSIESRTFFRDIYSYLTEKGMSVYKIFPDCFIPIHSYSYVLDDFQGRNYVALLPDISSAIKLAIRDE